MTVADDQIGQSLTIRIMPNHDGTYALRFRYDPAVADDRPIDLWGVVQSAVAQAIIDLNEADPD